MPAALVTESCPSCLTLFTDLPLSGDEDGNYGGLVPGRDCAEPGCGKWLCEAGCEHESFECESCRGRFCLTHLVEILDMQICAGCAEPNPPAEEAAPELECETAMALMLAARTQPEMRTLLRMHSCECVVCAPPEPECECRRTDVDRWDARGCPLCDPESEFQERLREAQTAARRAA